MEAAGIQVIIGTPTYAIPSWMEKSYPDILAETKKEEAFTGQGRSWTLPIRCIYFMQSG